MSDVSSPRLILLDIEGTVAPVLFVREVLFPYARLRMEAYLRQHWSDPIVASARAMLNGAGEFSEQALASLKAVLFKLMASDVKSTALKQLQGLIWDEGYRAGEFQSPVFADVPPALRRWTECGKSVAIYSSGSVAAQKVFFQHTSFGDLTPYLSDYFDTTTGPKQSSVSYIAIAAGLKTHPADIVFISDIPEELLAAEVAGLRTLLAVRPGNSPVATEGFDRIATFEDLF